MDTTPIESMISELDAADPAEAPPLADAVADALTEELEGKPDDAEDEA